LKAEQFGEIRSQALSADFIAYGWFEWRHASVALGAVRPVSARKRLRRHGILPLVRVPAFTDTQATITTF